MAALLDRGAAGDTARDNAGGEVNKLAEAVRDCAGRVVVVSPEVGLSVVPATEAGRAFAERVGVNPNTVARWERDEVTVGSTAAILIRLLAQLARQRQRRDER